MEKKFQKISNFRVDYAMEDPTRPDDTDWYEKDSYLTSVEEFDMNGNVVKTLSFNHAGDISEHYQYKFDERNNMTEELIYFDEHALVEHHIFTYDQSDKRIEEKVTYEEGGEIIVEYSYDEHGNMVQRLQKDSEGEIEETEKFEYDNGKIMRTFLYDVDNMEVNRREYAYNENGKLIKFSFFSADPDASFVTENFYDEKGVREKTLKYNSKNQLIEKTIYTTDETDKVIEIYEEDVRSVKKTCFTHDDKNNVVKQEEFNKNDELILSIERTFNEEGTLLEALVYIQDPSENIRSMYASKYEYEFYN